MTTEKNIGLYTGLGEIITVIVKDREGALFDLTGWSFDAHIRNCDDGTLLLDLTPIVTDAVHGVVTITIDDSETVPITEKVGELDMIPITPGGLKLTPVWYGTVQFKIPITRIA